MKCSAPYWLIGTVLSLINEHLLLLCFKAFARDICISALHCVGTWMKPGQLASRADVLLCL